MREKFSKKVISLLLAMAMLFAVGAIPVSAAPSDLPTNCVIGYWENWVNSESPNIKLSEVDPNWDVVIVSFLICDSTNYTGIFDVDNTLYSGSNKDAEFKADVEFCQARGQKVLISIGGATGKLSLTSTAQRDIYYESVKAIIAKYGFDGIDVDFENSILNVSSTDTLDNPTTNIQNYLNYILHQLVEDFGSDFMVTMAPEHPYVQGGAVSWGGYYGGYLPLINLTRDIITFIHPQYYNNPIAGYDGSWGTTDFGFSGYNVDSLVKISEMLINGFETAKGERFEGLRPDQVAFGVPCSSTAAGSGYLPISDYQSALKQLLQKYPTFRGAMTWSINYDAANNEFVTKMSETIDTYGAEKTISVSSITADKSGSVKTGTSITWNVTTEDSNGTILYKYQLMKDGAEYASTTSAQSSYTAVLSEAGTYTLNVEVTDSSASATGSWTDGITAIAPLSIESVSVSSGTVTITTQGGEGGNVYFIYLLKDGKVAKSAAYSSTNQISVSGLESGIYSVRAYAQDVAGTRVVNVSQVTV